MVNLNNPLIVQSDGSLLLEVHNPRYDAARGALARFAELEKSPEHIHTYRVTPLSLWNAAAAGAQAAEVVATLEEFAKYGVPQNVAVNVREWLGRYGKLRLLPGGASLRLEIDDPIIGHEIEKNPTTAPLVRREGNVLYIDPLQRGTVKQRLARLGYPVDDQVGFLPGEDLAFKLRDTTRAGHPFALRPYQQSAVQAFTANQAGHGVLVLPCGAGKTVIGIAAAVELQSATLIVCTNISSARQWVSEILDKTTLSPDDVGEYSGHKKQIRPITVATYHILSRRQGEAHPHFELFSARPWGLVIYDEVHLLPAPVFRITAEVQAKRRLGLTATLVREDGLETDVFSLVGPKRFDVPWKEMEQSGFIAQAFCHEIRVDMPGELKVEYAATADEPQRQYRVAAENTRKDDVVASLIAKHDGESILVIGQYLRQLQRLATRLAAPLIIGEVAETDREALYDAFRRGEIKVLVVSRVANFSIDLPDASVCIQVSGSFGSRQEEAQRLGRILRPKKRDAFFYSVISHGTSEMRFAMNRQLFLTEQGYRYYIEDWQYTPPPPPPPALPGPDAPGVAP